VNHRGGDSRLAHRYADLVDGAGHGVDGVKARYVGLLPAVGGDVAVFIKAHSGTGREVVVHVHAEGGEEPLHPGRADIHLGVFEASAQLREVPQVERFSRRLVTAAGEETC
jgi:hypothetical protein